MSDAAPDETTTEGAARLSLVIDTEQFAGSFERPMAAYVLGARGEFFYQACRDLADRFDAEVRPPLCEDLVGVGIDDDDDVVHESSATIYPTPGWYNNGNGRHFRGAPDRPGRYLAYLSVRVFLDREPTREEVELVKERARFFAANLGDEPIVVTGFRLVRERTVATSRPL